MRWFTSDIHFWHRNVIQYCNRPWATVEEMNQGIIERFNALVKPEDEVFCFGDFSLNWQGAEMRKYLNGTWYLVPGNHDKCHSVFHKEKEEKKRNAFSRYEQMGWIILPEYYSTILTPDGRQEKALAERGIYTQQEGDVAAQICHFPFKEDHGNFEQTPRYQNRRPKPSFLHSVLLHGHVHNAWKVAYFWDEKGKRFIPQINLGVDVWDWKPVSELELLEYAKNCLTEAKELTKLKLELPEVEDEITSSSDEV